MKGKAAESLKDALTLPTDARPALAPALLDSLDPHVDEDAEAAWATEVNRRVADLEGGTVRTIPWPEVRRRLFPRARPRAVSRLRRGFDLQWVPDSRGKLHRP